MKKYDAEKLPAYESIKAALAAPSDAPARLTPDRRTRILNAARASAAVQPTFADRLARWFDFGFFPKTSTRYAVMRALVPVAITIFIVLGIGSLLVPATSQSLKRGRRTTAANMAVKRELEKVTAEYAAFPPAQEDGSYKSHRSYSVGGGVGAAAPASSPTPIAQPAEAGEAGAKDRVAEGDEITIHFADETIRAEKRDASETLGRLEADREIARGAVSVGGEVNGRFNQSDRSDPTDRSDFGLLNGQPPVVFTGLSISSGKASRSAALRRSSGERAPQEESSAESAPAKPSAPAPNGPAGVSIPLFGSIPSTESTKSEKPLPTEPPSSAIFKPAGFNPFVDSAQNAFSTFSIDVDTASYTLTRNFLMQDRLPPPEAVRTEEIVNYFDYHYPAPANDVFAVRAECAPAPFGPGLQLLRIGVKARQLGREENKPAMLMFLIDSSGSMSTPDRFDLVKQSLRLLVGKLAPEDRVAIVQFDSHARLVLDYTRAADKARILQAVDALQTSGSTNLEEGMRLAYELARRAFQPGAANRVLLLSDGAANLGSASAESILATVADSRRQGIFCSVYGVGRGGYNDVMLETLANKGDGVYTFLDSLDEAKRVFVDDLAATLNTVASDVKIQVEFNPARVKVWRQLGYENRALRKEDFRNDAVDAGEVGSGQSVTALYELSLVPNSKGPLGTVRVRCRDLRTGRVEESESPLSEAMFRARWADAGAPFKLAACAAELAEILRGSPFSGDSDPAELAALLRPVALDYSLDTRVQELLRLVEKTADIKRESN